MKISELFNNTSMTKKTFLLMLIIISVILVCSCANKQDIESTSASENDIMENSKNVDEQTTIMESFLEKVQGVWVGKYPDGTWDTIEFNEDKFSEYIHRGHVFVDDGQIESVELQNGNEYKVNISYKKIAWGEKEDASTHMAECVFTSDDDFRRSLIWVLDDTRVVYTYSGKNPEGIDGTIAEIMKEEYIQKVEQDLENLINDQKQFMDFDSKSTVSISALPEVNKRYIGKPYRYATVDLDGDDIKELLIEFDLGGDTAILSLQNENWIAYYCAYRARTHLKTDGTMSWSSSATRSGIHMLHFDESGIISVPIITYDEDGGYYVNGASVTRTECLEAMQKQQQKPNVTWYELN